MKTLTITTILMAFSLSGCTSTPQTKVEVMEDQIKAEKVKNEAAQEKAEHLVSTIPSWVLEPPQSSSGVYGVGIGESRNLDIAIKKSNLNAQFELAKSLGQEISGNEQNYTSESSTKTTTQYTQLIDSLVDSIPMNGFETVEHEMITIDGKFTSYRLMHLSYKQIERSLNLASKETEQAEIKAAFIELEERLEQRN